MTLKHPQFLEAASRIGHRLSRDAVWANGSCNWLGWSMEYLDNKWGPAYKVCDSNLYSGTAGISLFFAKLLKNSGDKLFKASLEGGINSTLEQAESINRTTSIGFYSGIPGIAHTLIEAGDALQQEEIINKGLGFLEELQGNIPQKVMIDVISGPAGTIPFLLGCAKRFKREKLTATAIAYGESLLKLAIPSDEGTSWDTMGDPTQKNLTGYSHGVAGMVCAMLELHKVTNDKRYLDTAIDALRYERSHFVREQGNWPDFRNIASNNSGKPTCNMAWCHGAPGIGMARLRTVELLKNDPKIMDEIKTAINTTAASLLHPPKDGIGNYSLCHGASGNADLLILAADQLKKPELKQRAEQIGLQGIQQIEMQNLPWPCGVPEGGETPNLLLGLAGIGYFYLRLYDSQTTPSILLLKG
ncbi:MAG: type 2 lantipeptide synthetase LanM [Magnetococcales bacterium]|nr:type 2 lantipeptide synthetase LanM [Magnetococcales bacterium]